MTCQLKLSFRILNLNIHKSQFVHAAHPKNLIPHK